MKVWAVTVDDVEDGYAERIFSTKEKAQAFYDAEKNKVKLEFAENRKKYIATHKKLNDRQDGVYRPPNIPEFSDKYFYRAIVEYEIE